MQSLQVQKKMGGMIKMIVGIYTRLGSCFVNPCQFLGEGKGRIIKKQDRGMEAVRGDTML
jgi:hypothetical protein